MLTVQAETLMLKEFTETIRCHTDPLFSKSCRFKKTTSFETPVRNSVWFDNECVEHRNRYYALNKFYLEKSYENRMSLCEYKKYYKMIVKKKKNANYRKKMQEIENLRSLKAVKSLIRYL